MLPSEVSSETLGRETASMLEHYPISVRVLERCAFLIPVWVECLHRLMAQFLQPRQDRKSTRLNSSHIQKSRMPSSA